MRLRASITTAALLLPFAVGVSGSATAAPGDTVHASLFSPEGGTKGSVSFTELADGRVRVNAVLEFVPEGFHGINVSTSGTCTGSFASAGEHLGTTSGNVHGAHQGDLPLMRVGSSGTAEMTVVTDRFTLADLTGRGVVVHAKADNYANIPDTDGSGNRYDSTAGTVPDPATRITGDSGTRIACGAIGSGPVVSQGPPDNGDRATAFLIDTTGAEVGTVDVYDDSGRLRFDVEASGLTPGFHGFHVHAGTACTTTAGAPDFSLAQGHYDSSGSGHGGHDGDLPVLLAGSDGRVSQTFTTEALDLTDIRGRAVVIHAGSDNFANIPASDGAGPRYSSPTGQVPDATTLAAGDGGSRANCGVLSDTAHAAMIDASGASVGDVTFVQEASGDILVWADLQGQTPGFHGFHVHAGPACTTPTGTPDFSLAQGHYDTTGSAHGAHDGDLPALQVRPDGTTTQATGTTLRLADLRGRTVVVHSGPDNVANIPARYSHATGTGPDATTLAAGDAGSRVACGEIVHEQVAAPDFGGGFGRTAIGFFIDQNGAEDGIVIAEERADGGVDLLINALSPTPGFHGIHVHSGNRCTDATGTPDFSAAGGHLAAEGQAHGQHTGDLPPVRTYAALAGQDDSSVQTFVLDGVTFDDLVGRTLVVHAGADNLANIPARYTSAGSPGPDATTLESGDGGARESCAVLESFGFESVTRLAGNGRVATAVEISRNTWSFDAASAVVLARADDFADGLAGTPLAAAELGPVLLTGSAALDPAARAELDRVLPAGGRVYLLGGPNALDPAIETELTMAGYDVLRLRGASRIETAIEVARQLGDPDKVLITTGFAFPDAVAAGAAAAHTGGAVLLTTADQPHAALDAYLASHPGTPVTYAIGGPATRAYPKATPVRGASREETAVAVATTFFTDPSFVGIARRDAFADALAGGVHAALRGGPVVLTGSTALHPAVAAYLCANEQTINGGAVYGGPNAISDQVLVDAQDAVQGGSCSSGAAAGRTSARQAGPSPAVSLFEAAGRHGWVAHR